MVNTTCYCVLWPENVTTCSASWHSALLWTDTQHWNISIKAITGTFQHFRDHKFDTYLLIHTDPKCPNIHLKLVFGFIPVLQLWFNVSKFCLRKSSWPSSAAPVTFNRASSTLVTAPHSTCSTPSSSELSKLMESESLESEKAERHKRRLQINPERKHQ